MDKKLKIAIPVITGVLAIGIGTGTAFANADHLQTAQPQTVRYEAESTVPDENETAYLYYCGGYRGMMGYAGFGITQQLADLLNSTPAEIQSQLNSGTTLAEIATAQDVTEDQLVETVTALFNDHIDLMVKYGYLSEDDAVTLRQQTREQVRNIVNTQYDQNSWWDYMDEMMDEYGHGMMWGWGGPDSDEAPNNAPDTDYTSGSGYGGMMGGWGSSRYQPGYGGMMGGFGGGFGGMMR